MLPLQTGGRAWLQALPGLEDVGLVEDLRHGLLGVSSGQAQSGRIQRGAHANILEAAARNPIINKIST